MCRASYGVKLFALLLNLEDPVKKLLCIISFICVGTNHAVTIGARQTKKMAITIAGIDNNTNEMKELCQTVSNDLQFTGQFEPRIIHLQTAPQQKQITNYKGYGPLLLTVAEVDDNKMIEWRLYNTRSGKMVAGKKGIKRGSKARYWGHAVAERALEIMTDQKNCFSSKLVYCKEAQSNKKQTKICIADFDGRHEKVLVDPGTLAIAPRWNSSASHPLVLYSEYTPSNMRLMAADLRGKCQVATSFDGLNMLPAFSDDGKQVVVCLSVEGSSQLYRYQYNEQKKRPEYIRLTHNKGNNLSPVILNDGSIVFCSDFETKRPQIYKMNQKGKNLQKLSEGGCCTSPSYSASRNLLAYSKLVDGVSQIMLYDLKEGTTKQLTTDLAHKEESSWSPCGNYLVFSVSDQKTKRLAVHNMSTGQRRFITGSAYRYSYPSWSPAYAGFSALS